MKVKSGFTPPYGNVSLGMKACSIVLALVLLVLASILAVSLSARTPNASAADSLPVYYVDTLSEIPAGEVFLTDLTYEHATVNIKDSRFSFSTTGSQPSVVYNGAVSVGTTYTFVSPFTVDFKEAGYTVDGHKVDVSIIYDRVSFIPIQATTATQTAVAMFNRLGGNSPFAFYAQSYGKPLTKIEATIKITDSYTHELVPNLAQLTFTDLDGYDASYPDYAEGVTLGEGFIQTYLRKDHIFDKNRIASSNGRSFAPSSYKEAAGWEEWYMASTYFTGGQASLTWTGMWCGTEIGASYKGYPDWNAPVKTVTSSSPTDIVRPVTYEISQFLPYTAPTNQASSVTISDILPDSFDMSRTAVRMLDASRNDISDKWNIMKNGSAIIATAKVPYECLGQHYLVIETYFDSSADISPYIVAGEASTEDSDALDQISFYLVTSNTATTTINDESKSSPVVQTQTEVYPLIYDLNGGDSKGTANDIHLSEQEVIGDNYNGFYIPGSNVELSSGIPERAGHVFLGWSEERMDPSANKEEYDELVKNAVSHITMPMSTKTLHAMWARKPIVRFLLPTGEEIEAQELVPGEDAVVPESPFLAGYTFTGWSGSVVAVWENIDVEAVFEANKYTIVYDPNGGDGHHILSQEAAYDQELSIFDNPYERPNCEFAGWNTKPDGSGKSYAPDDVVKNLVDEPNGEVCLYAQWVPYIQMPETGSAEHVMLFVILGAFLAVGVFETVRRKI